MIRFLLGDEEREVADAALQLDVREIAPGSFELRRGTSREVFHCLRDGDIVHLFWRGASYRFEQLRDGRRAAQRHPGGGLEAPMPGKIIAIKAVVGQAVKKGEELLIVEAMKMENAIRAPRDGTVKTIAVKVGDMVAPGVVLAELE